MAQVKNISKKYVESEVADMIFSPGEEVSLPDVKVTEVVLDKNLELVKEKKAKKKATKRKK